MSIPTLYVAIKMYLFVELFIMPCQDTILDLCLNKIVVSLA